MGRTVCLKKSKAAFGLERMVCRLLASWCSLCAYWLLKDAGFGELAYRQGMSMGFVCLCVGLLFFVYSFFCIRLYRKNETV